MMYWGTGLGWGGMLFGGLMMLLFWGLLIGLAVLVVRALSNSGSKQSDRPAEASGNRALAILKERYARGEITKDEYESVRRDLLG